MSRLGFDSASLEKANMTRRDLCLECEGQLAQVLARRQYCSSAPSAARPSPGTCACSMVAIMTKPSAPTIPSQISAGRRAQRVQPCGLRKLSSGGCVKWLA